MFEVEIENDRVVKVALEAEPLWWALLVPRWEHWGQLQPGSWVDRWLRVVVVKLP